MQKNIREKIPSPRLRFGPLLRRSWWVLLLALITTPAAFAGDKFIALGTSSKSGVYYPVGQGVCALLNRGRAEHGYRCSAYSTGGSLYNIFALDSGQLDLVITRGDLVEDAFNAKGDFKGLQPMTGIRLVANLYSMPVAVIVKTGSRIKTLSQIKGHNINIGNLGSGKRTIADMLLKILGWDSGRFSAVYEYDGKEAKKAFCAGELDVMIEATGFPSEYFDSVIKDCEGRFLPLPSEVIEEFKSREAFARDMVIPGNYYASNPVDVPTVGVPVVLASYDTVSEEAIYRVIKGIFDNFGLFRKVQPVLEPATPEYLIDRRGSVELHSGVTRFLKEAGLEP